MGTATALSVLVSNGVPDTAAPSVAISAPGASTTVSGVTTVTAAASDNVGVTKVELYVDGVLKATDAASPYTFAWDTTAAANGTHSLTAKAYDGANATTSGAVSVTVSNVAALVTETFTGNVGVRKQASSTTWSITVAGTGTVSANLSWGAKGNLDLAVYNSAGQLVVNGTQATSTSETLAFVAAPGQYTFVVSAASGNGSYTLKVTHP